MHSHVTCIAVLIYKYVEIISLIACFKKHFWVDFLLGALPINIQLHHFKSALSQIPFETCQLP